MKAYKLALVSLFALTNLGWADLVPIVDVTGGSLQLNATNETYGYSFTVSGSSITVSGLGVFEAFARPLASSHAVGLWDSTGTLLVSATVSGGSTAIASTDSLGDWREVGVTPLSLAPGTYFAGVYYNINSEDILVAATPHSQPGITYNSAQFAFGTSLQFPTATFPTTLIGPAVFTSAVPEPASIMLLGTGLLVVAWRLRRPSQRR